ncbi:MAG TPA: pyridoxal-phosphate dependent enzyme [Nitrososphaerales archaeon]|nr:pyridoxal-phosphate dependent enzyme [Nitrososphaerales archaeon]
MSLGEGATPLIHAKRLGAALGFNNLWLKDESRNPTGSFIDRGSTVLVSLAKERGVGNIACTTTGNLGALLAAYCAKAGMGIETRIPPNTDHRKLYQTIAYGARVEIISKVFSDIDSELHNGALPITTANPFILEGEKTTVFEIIQDLDREEPDAIVVPVWTGGHLTMIWRGIQQLQAADLVVRHEVHSPCRLIGVQLQASAPIVDFLQLEKERSSRNIVIEKPFTELKESEPIFKKTAARAIRSSKGAGVEVSTKEAIQATSLLARSEGIFAEPASASVVASLKQLRENELLDRDDRNSMRDNGIRTYTKTIAKIATTPKAHRLERGKDDQTC